MSNPWQQKYCCSRGVLAIRANTASCSHARVRSIHPRPLQLACQAPLADMLGIVIAVHCATKGGAELALDLGGPQQNGARSEHSLWVAQRRAIAAGREIHTLEDTDRIMHPVVLGHSFLGSENESARRSFALAPSA